MNMQRIFNRSQRTIPPPVFHQSERLNRLDHELLVNRTKQFDYLYLRSKDIRVRICVMVDEDRKSYATAQVGDRAFRSGGGHSPSGSVFLLQIAIKVYFAEQPEAEKARLRLEYPINLA